MRDRPEVAAAELSRLTGLAKISWRPDGVRAGELRVYPSHLFAWRATGRIPPRKIPARVMASWTVFRHVWRPALTWPASISRSAPLVGRPRVATLPGSPSPDVGPFGRATFATLWARPIPRVKRPMRGRAPISREDCVLLLSVPLVALFRLCGWPALFRLCGLRGQLLIGMLWLTYLQAGIGVRFRPRPEFLPDLQR